jgi:hypothetical protein
MALGVLPTAKTNDRDPESERAEMVRLTTELNERLYGFHPTLRTTVTMRSEEREALDECAVGLVFAGLPEMVIVDRYQLRVLYEEGRLSEPRVVPSGGGPLDLLVWADPDLEGPASRPDPPGLGGLMVPLPLGHFDSNLSLIIPLHLRYLPPILDSKTHPRPVRDVLIQPPSLVKWCNQSSQFIILLLLVHQILSNYSF